MCDTLGPRLLPCGVAINTLDDLNKLAGESPSFFQVSSQLSTMVAWPLRLLWMSTSIIIRHLSCRAAPPELRVELEFCNSAHSFPGKPPAYTPFSPSPYPIENPRRLPATISRACSENSRQLFAVLSRARSAHG